MKKAKILSVLLCIAMLVGLIPFTMAATAENVTTVYLSNKYGSDSNDGKTANTAVKTIAGAINKIGKANDGTVIVLDGKDSSGKAEYEVYTRSSSQPYTYGGTQNVVLYENVPAHTGTITYVGDANDSVICFGMNHMVVSGPSVFKNLTFIEGYNVGKNIITMGHSVTFEGTIGFIRTFTTSSTTPNAGLRSPGGSISVDVAGRNATTASGTMHLKSGTFGEVAFGGWDNNITVPGDQTIHVDGATISSIKLRNSGGNWKMQNLSVVIDSGKVTNIADSGSGAATAKAVQIVMNNGINVPYTSTGMTLSEGEWVLKARADESGAKLALTDTVGKYEVVGDLLAVAFTGSGDRYVSENGYLTVPAGTYTVTWQEELSENQIVVKYDGVASEDYYEKGSELVLPTLSDTPAGNFLGWSCDGIRYAGGDALTLPTDVSEINFVSEWEEIEGVAVVFVDSNNGSDENDGSQMRPFATLPKAVSVVDNAAEEEKYVVIVGEMMVDASFGTHKNMITFTGDTIHIYKNSVPTGGPATFENITIKQSIASKFIESNSSTLIMGENVKFESTISSVNGISYHIGTNNADGGREKFVHTVGTAYIIYVGAYYNTQARHKTDGADIIIDGGNIARFRLGADGWTGGPTYGVDFTDDVNITLNGGTVPSIDLAANTYAPSFGGALQIILNNGMTTQLPDADPAGGYWIIHGENNGGSRLEATEKAGEYKVVGDLTAVASERGGSHIYISASGYLAIPVAGEYDVTYTDEVYYTNTGLEVEFLKDYSVDFENLRHVEYDDRLFIGWADENGNGVYDTSFKAGDKLFANYVDCDLEDGGDFFIKGVQVRTQAPSGLRFVVEKTDALTDALDVSEYGSVIVPTEVMGTKPLYIDETYTLNDKQYSSKTVEGKRTFAETDDGIQYTVCVINFTEDLYRRNYTVRGYIKYTDLNGNQKVLYTDSYATSIYTVAKEALKDTSVSEADRTYLESIKNYVDETMKQEYLSRPKTNLVGTSADLKTWIYRLGTGVIVREVEIDSGIGGSDVEIVQLSDTHFNYCNEEDLKDPVLASTWEYRHGFRYPGTQTALLNSIEYAGYSDQIVVTGDAIDYLSKGCIELLYTYLWNIYPDALIALGNHEPVKKMQGVVAETTTVAQRYEELKAAWRHDVYYTEKILKNAEGTEKVMIIQLDNSQNKFWDVQVEQLEASIAKAREKDIPILVFAHIPLNTRNPEDASLDALRINDKSSSPANFYNGFFNVNSGASKQVYDLITMNADIIKGYFCGHWHCDFYTEIWSKNPDGTDNPDVVIPQYVMTGSAYEHGHALRITVK